MQPLKNLAFWYAAWVAAARCGFDSSRPEVNLVSEADVQTFWKVPKPLVGRGKGANGNDNLW